jgi:hypothetical protein
MTRDQVEHIRRAAQAAHALRFDPNMSIQFTFRSMDIFAQLATPAAIIDLCNEALAGDESCGPSEAEIADAEQALIDADRYRKARAMHFVSERHERIIDLAIEREEG